MDQEINYLKKRLEIAQKENDLLRKENNLMRKDLSQLKQTFTNIVSDKRVQTAGPNGKSTNTGERFQNEIALRQILEMQRTRIDELENENNQIKNKYEKLLFQNQGQVTPYSQILVNQIDQNELYELRRKNSEYELNLRQMAQNQARELAQLKQKIAQQDAELILNKSLDSAKASVQYYERKSMNQQQLEAIKPKSSQNISQNQSYQYQVLQQFTLNKKSPF